MQNYTISSSHLIIRDEVPVEPLSGKKAVRAELSRVYAQFLSEIDTEIKNREVPLKMSEKQNLSMLFKLLLDMHTAAFE